LKRPGMLMRPRRGGKCGALGQGAFNVRAARKNVFAKWEEGRKREEVKKNLQLSSERKLKGVDVIEPLVLFGGGGDGRHDQLWVQDV